jgi:hypothetical protein
VVEYDLAGSEIFIFTDNSTAEAAFWKGTSKSRRLFELVLRLKELEMKHELIIHVLHVSGRRMIAQGTDSLSRADHSEGVMQGLDIQAFIPLHLTPTAQEPNIKPWLDRHSNRRNELQVADSRGLVLGCSRSRKLHLECSSRRR